MKIFFLIAFIVYGLAKMTTDQWVALGEAGKKAAECKPFGLRINWGRSINDPSSSQKLGIRFNTFKKCENVNLLVNEAFIIHCSIRNISRYQMVFDPQEQQFRSFTHQCSLTSQIEYDKSFTYNILDIATQNTYYQKDYQVLIKDPFNKQRSTKFIHLSDWAKIKWRSDKRPSVSKVVKEMAQRENIDGVIVNGDMAYDLNSNVQHHLEFMEMLEEISKTIPVIFNRGNHEYGESGKIFCEYFQVYGLCQKNATGLQIGSVFLSLFDPHAALIPRLFHHFTLEERKSSKNNLALNLEKAKISGRIPIALSHYPLICSYPAPAHCIPHEFFNQVLPLYINLQEHFNTLLDYKVLLFLSGHVHTYERSHKLLRGYRYQSTQSNGYIYNKNEDQYLIHVVDGVAGSDVYLCNDYTYKGQQQKVQPFVASYNLGTVGFGYFEVYDEKIFYEHFGVNKNLEVLSNDKFTISLRQKTLKENEENNLEL